MASAGFGHENVQHYNAQSSDAFRTFTCGHCGVKVAGALLAVAPGPGGAGAAQWVRCSSCAEPSVISLRGDVYPGRAGGVDVEGLPTDVRDAYQEARRCMTVNAFTACELVCRKILMHVAADRAGAKAGATFASYVDSLEKAGYITPPMKAWVDLIRQHANEATHGLPPTSKERGEGTLMFTAELLRIVYEMEHLAKKYSPAIAVEAEVAAAEEAGAEG